MATLYDKIWKQHVIHDFENGTSLVYIDRHILHEVTSPQAFEGLQRENRSLYNPKSVLATLDHNVPTINRHLGIEEADSKQQIEALRENCKKYNVMYFDLDDPRQGIVHIIGPEQGFTLPGITLVCGDSHTSTHGAFGALAFGIGTSEIEQVLASQTLIMKKSKNMLVEVNGFLNSGISAKDIILYIISKIGIAGGTGHVIEYCGSTIKSLSSEGRMTICNMSVEAGARAGLIAPDQCIFDYLERLKLQRFSKNNACWTKAVNVWQTLYTDEASKFDRKVCFDAKNISPQVSWGTNPEMTCAITDKIPDYVFDTNKTGNNIKQISFKRALEYMGLTPGMQIEGIKLDQVFIGSCTNARIEDLREVANIVKGHQLASGIKRAMIVPGSGLVKQQAEKEGIDRIFKESGFEWRDPGCSMCLGMNADRLQPGERCASTSNRNFEGRQGKGGRTHLMSPSMAAYAAIKGYIADVRESL